jgi:F-type H+-transporting ATPase subunit gamma
MPAIKSRIRSVTNIRKITHAMEMVSMSKLNRVRSSLFAMRAYFAKLDGVLNDFLSHTGYAAHALLERREKNLNACLCVVTSDTGLCSTYNENIITAAKIFLANYGKENVKLVTVGKEGNHHFKKLGYDIRDAYLDLHGRYPKDVLSAMTRALTGIFLSREADAVYVAYTHFESTLRHRPRIEKFLNMEIPDSASADFMILEPDAAGVADKLIPKYLEERFRLMMLEALTSEHAARMFAMKTATDNADELMDTLTLMRNKARQAAITKEVIEVASGTEAMKMKE